MERLRLLGNGLTLVSRGGPASRFLLPVSAAPRSGTGRALAGAFLLLCLGALDALPAQAQTTPSATISAPTSPITEGESVRFAVTLSRPAPKSMWVYLTVTDATGGSDFLRSGHDGSRKVWFIRGWQTEVWAATTIDDDIVEANGQITATLTSGPDYTLGATTTASVTVHDNDPEERLNPRVTPVASTTDSLRVSWDAFTGADKYLVKWRAGRDSFNTGREVTATSTTLTGLDSGENYQVEVSAIDTDPNPDRVLAREKARGKPHPAAIPNLRVTAVSGRSDQLDVSWDAPAEGALNQFYLRWKESGTASYGDDYASSVTRVQTHRRRQPAAYVNDPRRFRIGGLKAGTAHDVEVVARRSGDVEFRFGARAEVTGTQTNNAPSVLVEGGNAVTEGAPASFGVRLSGSSAPEGGLTVNVTVADGTSGGDYLDASEEGAKQWTVPEGQNNATFSIPTVDDDQDEPNDQIRVTLNDGTGYTIAVDGETGVARRTVQDNDPPEPVRSGAAPSFIVYHDPEQPGAAVDRYDTAVGLLTNAGRSYTLRNVTGTSEVDRLAGVSNSVLPRFFLDDPEEEGWGPSEPGVNNGGLKWLRSVLAEPQTPSPTPAVSIAAGPAVTEGTEAAFTVTLSAAAPPGGLTLAYGVSEDGDFVRASDEGAKTLVIDVGATSATLEVPTAGDDDDEADGAVTVTLTAGTGYTLGSASSASVTVRDDDDAAALPAITVYHDPAGATGRYDTAVELLTAAGRSYTVRFVTGTGEVDRLAGVSGSVMPRFFLGDPEEGGWGPSQPGVNNGGLRWLRSQLAVRGRSQASSAPAVPTVSVADASAEESSGSITFEVTLSAAAGDSVSVDWATSNGTAVAGTDYTAASGALTFAPGETSKAVTVTLLDDAHDEGTEMFTLELSNPRPVGRATLADATATGSISNADPLQKDWLARFGRAAASDAVAAITARLQTPRDAGSHLTVGGQRFALDGSGGEAGLPPTPAGGPGGTSWPAWSDDPSGDRERTMSGRELLLGTSFRAVLGSGAGVQWTGWGQGASVSQFSSAGPGLSLSGEAATGSMGMDYERGPLLAGFAMTHSLGEGTAQGAGRTYALGSAVTTLLPYARFALSERVSAWGLAGTGSGRLTLDLDEGASERYGTDLSMTLAAAGVRGDLLTPAEANGFALALKADAFWVRTESEGVSAPGIGNLAGARADASRLRAVLDGSRRFPLSGGRALTPSVELGLRHDGGDAETGTGFELGAGVGYADPSRGLDMALRVHGLAAHAEDGYGEWSVSGSLRLEPGGEGRGFSMSLTPSYGADRGGSERLWASPDASRLAENDDAPLSSRLDAEVGYGMVVFGGGFTGTPHVGFRLSDTAREYRMGWRLSPAGAAGDFSFRIDASRRDSAGDTSEHRVGFGIGARW